MFPRFSNIFHRSPWICPVVFPRFSGTCVVDLASLSTDKGGIPLRNQLFALCDTPPPTVLCLNSHYKVHRGEEDPKQLRTIKSVGLHWRRTVWAPTQLDGFWSVPSTHAYNLGAMVWRLTPPHGFWSSPSSHRYWGPAVSGPTGTSPDGFWSASSSHQH